MLSLMIATLALRVSAEIAMKRPEDS